MEFTEMKDRDIITLAEKANEVNENSNSPVRYWFERLRGESRFFICNNIGGMDNIDEVSEAIFIKRAQRTIQNLQK